MDETRILFLPFALPGDAWTGEMARMLARQVPRQGAVLLSVAPALEARFALLGEGEGGRPAFPPRALPGPAAAARRVRERDRAELFLDGVVRLGSFLVRLVRVRDGRLLWERRYEWKLPTLQRAIRGLAGGLLERLDRSRGDLAPWICHSPHAFYRYLRAEEMALGVRRRGGEKTALRAFSAYRGAVTQDPRFTPAVEGLVRLVPRVPPAEARAVLEGLAPLQLGARGLAWIAQGLTTLAGSETALPLWRRCLDQDPCQPWAARAVGDDHYRRGREEEALRVWQRAAADRRADPSLLARLAVLHRERGRLEEAERLFARLPGRKGVTGDIWHAYGALLEERYGPSPGADRFARALGEDPPPEAVMDLGLMLVRAGRPVEAQALGRELERSRDREAARLGTYLVAAAQSPETWERLRRGTALLEAGHYRAARRRLQAVVGTWPHFADLHYLLGQACLREGRNRQGVEALRRCLGLDPSFPGARSKLGIGLVALGRFEEGYNVLIGALADNPRSVSVLTHLAQACHYLGNRKEGEMYLRRAMQQAPDHPVVRQTAREFFSG